MTDDDPKAVRHDIAEFELTLRVRKRTDARQLRELFKREHAYGPVERLIVERDMHSAHRSITADEGEYIDVVSVEEADDA